MTEDEMEMETIARGTTDMKQVVIGIHTFKKAYYCKRHKTYLQTIQQLGLHFEILHKDEYEVLEERGGKLVRIDMV